jgi:hypothetical protein|tara:strand:- start:949 stop:1191 length:243 start_codon:yes stop_codon:yes gene_type:complete
MEQKIFKIRFQNHKIYLETESGEIKSHPLEWFPKLDSANREQLENYTLSPFGIHWPELDEDLSFEGFFNFEGPKEAVSNR